MSRRNQARRRRAYTKRQHEVRQRREPRPDVLPADIADGYEHDGLIDSLGLSGQAQRELLDGRHGGRAAA
ncbi:MAG TPA: hypothetical protein VM305_02360 [Candidatus Limnocylindrales bacterium]|nr:hypothetical protein [Candidatus Limnocylindrales bacterium]